MSIKRYKENVGDLEAKFNYPKKIGVEQNYPITTYRETLHSGMEKPKHYSFECDGDVHCVTVMPNRTVYFHNHRDMNEMVKLVTFDIMQNPKVADTTLPNCLRVLRGLRTRCVNLQPGYNRSTAEHYMEELLESNIIVTNPRTSLKWLHNPKPWREIVLNKYINTIQPVLQKELSYYGMNNEGNYKSNLAFKFNMAPSFSPSAVMNLVSEGRGWSKELVLTITVSPKWLIGVWLKDRAIVEKNLVLSIQKDYPNGTTLCMVAKQSHGFKIIPRLAVVDFAKQSISWINDDDKKHELLHQDKMPRRRRTKKEMNAAALKEPVTVNPMEPKEIKCQYCGGTVTPIEGGGLLVMCDNCDRSQLKETI